MQLSSYEIATVALHFQIHDVRSSSKRDGRAFRWGHLGPIAWQKFKDNLEFKLQVNSRRLHKVRFNKSQVNVKLKLQVTGRRLHEASLTSLRLSI